jgi:hypothetical protein
MSFQFIKRCPLHIFKWKGVIARINRLPAIVLFAIGFNFIGFSFPAHSYESDVHYGLTRWLAQKAGFAEGHSHLIATGNLNVDSGSLSTLALLPVYACLGRDTLVARDIQDRHFPSKVKVPADAPVRVVEPGSLAAREAIAKTLAQSKGNEGQYLGLFGAALHPLQDSWAHAGVPAGIAKFGPISCDARLNTVPPSQEGKSAHAAGLTFLSPERALAMAKATYEELARFPSISEQARIAQDWSLLEPQVRKFVSARTKTEKREWFVRQGIVDTGFLEGTTLPDGPSAGPLKFGVSQLPVLTNAHSMQHGVPPDAREFYNALIMRWLGDEQLETVVSEMAQVKVSDGKNRGTPSSRAAQLATRLKLWKLRDHGTWAQLAHLTRPYTAAEIARVNDQSNKSAENVAMEARQVLFPLVIYDPKPSPLLPYILHMVPEERTSVPRAIAILRLKHAPRDTLGLIAEKDSSGWRLVDLVSVEDQ